MLNGRAALEVGCPADLVVVDPNAENRIGAPEFSMGVNEPLAGQVLRGTVKATMVTGRWAFNTLLSGGPQDGGGGQVDGQRAT